MFSQFFFTFGYIDKGFLILAEIGVVGDKILKAPQCCQIVTGLEIEMTNIELILCKVSKTLSDSSLGL